MVLSTSTPRGMEVRALILRAIDQFWQEHGYAPTYRELGAKVKLAHSGVHYHLRWLKEEGLVDERPNATRTLRLSDAGRDALVTGRLGGSR